jgi:Domain of unknown function (DUF5666)
MNHNRFCLSGFLFCLLAAACPAQTPDAPPPQQDQTQGQPPEGGPAPHHRGQMEGHGTIGKITAIHGNAFVLTRPDGTNVTINITDKTEFRKDRQPAKQMDFKVGDFVMVHDDENSDHTVTAQAIAGRSANGGPGRPGGPGGGPAFGEMGKDFVAGEVKSIDAPKLTVLRTDNVTQTIELNEETSLRKGRESITMADIQPGDHVVMHGALQNNVFVPKNVVLLSPEQWERMQQFASGGGGMAVSAPSGASSGKPPQQ